MNIQIFGKSKCFNTRSAMRFFKERKIKYQFIDIIEKGLSKRELDSVLAAIIDIDQLFDPLSAPYESLNVAYIKRSKEDKMELLLAHPTLIKTPIVRDCAHKRCTVGKGESEWKVWLKP